MLFNSYTFLFAFLPPVLLVFYELVSSGQRRAAIGWLVFASFAFYACWRPVYLLLLGASIGFNYLIGLAILRARRRDAIAAMRALLALGIVVDLGALGFFKYAGFVVTSLNHVVASAIPLPSIVLPLAISFFTFNQIAFLADTFTDEAAEVDFLNYCLFVSFFPHLIAGPIVHHQEMIPQFERADLRYDSENLVVGVTTFLVGLSKKVVVADALATYADTAFAAAARGVHLTVYEAWLAALTYALQLYFDFSGYSDMAIGLARMFGIRFPINFFSPYRAANISDFWRRWHMTLSRFLREYLYIPLGGNRRGTLRRYANLMVTMLLGGLWHGAGWTFVVWGGLHGAFLVVHHAWTALMRRLGIAAREPEGWMLAAGRALTFAAVVFAWVPFRAANLGTAQRMWSSMLDLGALHGSGGHHVFPNVWIAPVNLAAVLLVAGSVFVAPNTEELMGRYGRSLGAPPPECRLSARLSWRPTAFWGFGLGAVTALCLVLLIHSHVFLYYQF